MMAIIKEELVKALEDLSKEDLKKFQWYLFNGVESFDRIPKSRLEKADRQDTVDETVQKFGDEGAVKITLIILEKMNQNQLAKDLRTTLKNGGVKYEEVGRSAAAYSAAGNPNNTSSHARQRIADNEEFLKKNRSALIDKVKNIVEIVDELNLTDEKRGIVQALETDQAQMRKVLDFTKSKKAAELLVKALWNKAGDVMEDLTEA